MNWRGHKNGGIVTSFIVFSAFIYNGISAEVSLLSAVLTFLFSLYPDTDIRSTSGKVFYGTAIPFTLYLLITNTTIGVMLLPILIIPQFSGHRGITHSLIGVLVVSVLVGNIMSKMMGLQVEYAIISIAAGYLTHLLLDSHLRIV